MNHLPLVLRLLLSAAYIGLGVWILTSRTLPSQVLNWIFGIACIGYGIFRGARAFRTFNEERQEA